MGDPIKKDEDLTVSELKQELRNRGAPLRGKKPELLERLRAYKANNNFRVELALEEVKPNFQFPDDTDLKDVNTNIPLPNVTRLLIELFFKKYNKSIDTSEAMYKDQFLSYVRYCHKWDCHFFKGVVHAEMKKKTTYIVCIKIANDSRILGSHCDCAAGEGGSAHCKHVGIVLLAIEDMKSNSKITTRQACTQELQTFHRPSKAYHGTPLKSEVFHHDNKKPPNYDPRPVRFRLNKAKERLYNLCAPYKSNMPFKHLLPPANPYAVELDHTYSLYNPQTEFLKAVFLYDVTDSDVKRIEEETRGQSSNPVWLEHRKYRITASHFKEVCSFKSPSAAKSIAKKILEPEPIFSDAVQHGIINESKAIDHFMAPLQSAVKEVQCGLFIMKDRPYIGASPDRLLAELTVIEVKCPYTARDNVINPFTVPYLCFNDKGELTLQADHEYMYQVQGQLAVTGREYCYFLVYTYQDFKHISLERNEIFISDMLIKLDMFYKEYFLPALLNKYYYRNYQDYSF